MKTKNDLLKLIQEQPEDKWVAGDTFAGDGRCCPLGWALQQVGVTEDDLYSRSGKYYFLGIPGTVSKLFDIRC
jgi:hypothetical protein